MRLLRSTRITLTAVNFSPTSSRKPAKSRPNAFLVVTHGETTAARRALSMTPRVRIILEGAGAALFCGFGNPSISAASATSRPPKNRLSTINAWGGLTRKLRQSGIERQELLPRRGCLLHGIVERHAPVVASAAFARIAASRCFDQNLAHRAHGDAFEVESRGGGKTRGARQLQPGLVDQSRGAERGAGVAAAHARGPRRNSS